jgi:DNA repair protein RadC
MDDGLHAGHRERLKQRFVRSGLDGFDDHQALELLLFYAVPRRDTNKMAHRLIKQFGSLHNLMSANPLNVAKTCKISLNTAVLITMVVPMFQKYSQSRMGKRPVIGNSRAAGEYALAHMRGKPMECFYLICLNSRKQLIYSELISEGTSDETSIYIKHIVETALKHDAASVILAHNHPSGALTASHNDIEATVSIINALNTIDVDVIDHIIIAGDDYLSFSEKRLLGLVY